MIASPPIPEKPLTESERRAMIRQRRKDSVFWAGVHLLGSLKLALFLIMTIAAAIAFATVMESRFDSKVASYYIYNAVWFNFWLLLLGLNLFCAALTRWPWQSKHLGFVVTHAGIICMLIGAVIGHTMGFEANVTLDKTKSPQDTLIFPNEMIRVSESSTGIVGELPIDPDFRPPTQQNPLTIPLANSTLVIDGSTQNLVPVDRLVKGQDQALPPGVYLRFLNAGMGQDVPAILQPTDDRKIFDFFGFAKVTWVDGLPEDQPIELPETSASFKESQMIFERHPEDALIVNDPQARSGYQFKLVVQGDKMQVAVQAPDGVSQVYALESLQQREMQLEGKPVRFRVAAYWPDFAMKKDQPVTLSNHPNNPAALIQIMGPIPSPPAGEAPKIPTNQGLAMRVSLSKKASNRLVYELERQGKVYRRAVADVGETISLGWSKWQAKVEAIEPHAFVSREVKEITGPIPPMQQAEVRPGLRAHLVHADGTTGASEWIPAGTTRDFVTETNLIRVGYGQKTLKLPFHITLLDLKVPRDEGTETPSDYISELRFDQPAQESQPALTVFGTAHMNEPAMFPGEFWRSLVGWNYKFSQANWNPQNLNETTLQVLYDPGWFFKWVGSVGICSGIVLMFYFMPKRTASQRGERDEGTTPDTI